MVKVKAFTIHFSHQKLCIRSAPADTFFYFFMLLSFYLLVDPNPPNLFPSASSLSTTLYS